LQDAIADKLKNGSQEIDMLGRTALELIGQGGLGCSFDSAKEGFTNPYNATVKMVMLVLIRF
ncbi:hypothetical protein BJ138DRAFT_985272, partial [Hygrophoropsis aurantiaca]